MQKLINAVQNYAWGSHTALTELYGIANSGQSADGRAVDGGASEEQFADPGGRRPAAFAARGD